MVIRHDFPIMPQAVSRTEAIYVNDTQSLKSKTFLDNLKNDFIIINNVQ